MAGIAILVDLLRTNPSFSGKAARHSFGPFSSVFSASASAAAASFAAGTPFAYRAFLGGNSIAYCDAGAALTDDYVATIRSASGNIFERDFPKHCTKQYNIELKHMFSAFHWKSLTLTSLRCFLLFYLPLLEPRSSTEEDDDDFLQDNTEEQHVDLVKPFKQSLNLILRETTVTTIRRLLERMAFYHLSRRMAWKLLKDVRKSALRKSEREMPTSIYFVSVCRTTLRGHFLGVVASSTFEVMSAVNLFLFQLVIKEEADDVGKIEKFKRLWKMIYRSVIRNTAALIFASIGAGIGATLIHPSIGQYIGCGVGDMAGPVVVGIIFDKYLHVEL